MLPFGIYFGLLLNFNIFWIATYILLWRRQHIDKIFGVPFIALSLNLSWDFLAAFVYPSPFIQNSINIIFTIFNLINTYYVLRYWSKDFGEKLTAREFYFFFVLVSIFTFVGIQIVANDLNDIPDFLIVGFIDNFINSALFIAMFYRRPNLEGQSLYIGLAKLIGTASVSIASWFNPWPGTENSLILPACFIGIFILDTIYVVLVHQRAKELGINPLRRF